jgi:hypothetical protein
MKQFLIILGFILLTSATTISTLSKRSKEQIVLHSSNIQILTTSINNYYRLGYRVIMTAPQSVSTSVNSYQTYAPSYPQRDMYGEILVIMKK